ncbi:MAG: alpha/beta fold hydrolase [Caulobacteraceae bacterium]
MDDAMRIADPRSRPSSADRSLDPCFVATRQGHRLFVRDWGSGAPILFLAGWAMTSDLWGQVMIALSDRGARAVAYDRRGHGRSSDTGAIDFDLLADDLAEVIDGLGLSDLTLVAQSPGAGEALRYVARHGQGRLARLVLVGASGPCPMRRDDNPDGLPPEAFAELARQMSGDLPAWVEANAEPFAPGASRPTLGWLTAMVLSCSRRIAIDFQAVNAGADFRAAAAALALQTTVIHGDLDASAPLDRTGRRYAALIAGAELIVYEGAAHALMVTHAQRLAEDIAARMGLRAA